MTDANLTWTDERVDLLKKLWIEGLSASQIATQLGNATRNAVIGKVHRLGLSGRRKIKKLQRNVLAKSHARQVRLLPLFSKTEATWCWHRSCARQSCIRNMNPPSRKILQFLFRSA